VRPLLSSALLPSLRPTHFRRVSTTLRLRQPAHPRGLYTNGRRRCPPTVVPYNPSSVYLDTAASISADLKPVKRGMERRDACQSQLAGSDPIPSLDTPEGFLSFSSFAAAATGAPTPPGYVNTFKNLQAFNSANAYMGYYALLSFSPLLLLIIFEVFERDPAIEPADACPNPSSTTVIKCVLWGGLVTADNANNNGQ
jgi:hypothetical protein